MPCSVPPSTTAAHQHDVIWPPCPGIIGVIRGSDSFLCFRELRQSCRRDRRVIRQSWASPGISPRGCSGFIPKFREAPIASCNTLSRHARSRVCSVFVMDLRIENSRRSTKSNSRAGGNNRGNGPALFPELLLSGRPNTKGRAVRNSKASIFDSTPRRMNGHRKISCTV